MTLKPNRNRFAGSCLIGSTALALEVLGVASGAYYYDGFPLKVLGVPPSIIAMWVGVAFLAYYVSSKTNIITGVLVAYSLDLVLDP